MKSKILSSLYALCPLLVFFFLFIGSGVYFSLRGQNDAFYQISASVAILPAIVIALYGVRKPLQEALSVFLEGARDKNIIIMCLIYLLAGAFATVLQNIGSVASTVSIVLNLVPPQAILPALVLISAAVSTAMGTSMGTIAAIAPIGVGIANFAELSLPITMGTIIGGAMFGDNLSMISDTSIAATQIQGCSPLEKFKNNAIIALPAMIITVLILSAININNPTTAITILTNSLAGDYQLIHCVPYLVVLALALLGINVFAVLVLGIVSAAIIGVITIPSYTLVTFTQNIFDGYKSMTEVLILSLLMGGLGELIKHNGGFTIFNQCLIYFKGSKEKITSKAAEIAISGIVGFSDICTANNTTAIILSGEATRDIAKLNHISPARAATLVDLFACVFQGILPYSAQVLMAGSLAGLSPIEIVPHVYYCYFLGLAGVAAIIFQFPKFSLKKATKKVTVHQNPIHE
jgi:Na+/H+ antiporter NhaC